STAVSRNADRAVAYGIPGVFIPDNAPFAMFEASKEAVERARSGKGPTLIEIETYRLYGHFEGDPEIYRPKEEVEKLRANDPIIRTKNELMRRGWLSEELDKKIADEAKKEVDEAIKFAIESPYPKPEEALEDVFAPSSVPPEPEVKGSRRLPMYLAISEAIAQEMEKDPTIIVMGEDVGLYGGIFGATYGLYNKFGPERVIDTPISEAGFFGAALGAAMSGLKPIVELMFVDFFGVGFDQMYNHIAKNHYMSGGSVKVPVVMQTAIGGGYSDAAQHSQVLYAIFSHVPGMKVVVPSNSFDAKGLMISSIRDGNPIMYMFHKGLMGLPWMPYPQSSVNIVPEEPYQVPIGKAKVVRRGRHVTIVGAAMTVHRAIEAAEKLASEGIEAEVIDLRTLKPLDRKTVLDSVKDTGHLVVVDEDYLSYGLTGELAAVAAEEALPYLKSYTRIAVPDVPIPYSRPLETFVLPSTDKIVESVKRSLGK
ncbi:MAG: 2-oxoglutarate dehydrogenase, partial [Thermoprotei archaeon]|nr:2-oxoglutarate dehydrogenase [Thermoprotei archaeon]